MRYLLVAINAKYIHSNPAIYSLKEYAMQNINDYPNAELIIKEYTINNLIDDILDDIYISKPDVIAFSAYIWNISYIDTLVREVKKILPNSSIWCGGPEISYRAYDYLNEHKEVSIVMTGEGEIAFSELIKEFEKGNTNTFDKLPGLMYYKNGSIIENEPAQEIDFNTLPFIYEHLDMEYLKNRIVYYESSRGCPFSCSYCLSSIDKCLRFRDIEKVKNEIQFFLDIEVPQVKFIDRTFNCKKERAYDIWKYIYEHDNGITNFHFEVAADLLTDAQIELISHFRPGLIQLEVGVQSTNPTTLKEIKRHCDMEMLSKNVLRIKKSKNIHQHLDLIAGLPYENLESFKKSFDDVYALQPDQLQLGFLKVLSGSYMKEHAAEYELSYKNYPPYEVLSTKWISYDDLLMLKRIETVVEIYYNSHQFDYSITCLKEYFSSAYELFEALGNFYYEHFDTTKKHSRISRYNLLLDFYKLLNKDFDNNQKLHNITINNDFETKDIASLNITFREILVLDIYQRENIKTRPEFANDVNEYKNEITRLKRKYDLSNHEHIEIFISFDKSNATPVFIHFDYNTRSPLTYSAKLNLLA